MRTGIGIGSRLALVGALMLVGAACSANRAPLFEAPKAMGNTTLVLMPEVRLGAAATGVDAATLADALQAEIRRGLAGQAIAVNAADVGEQADLRRALVEAIDRGRQTGVGRLRPGTELNIAQLLAPAASAGNGSVVYAVLTRALESADGWVPRAPGELMPRPEDRPDYVIPKTGAAGLRAGGVVELALVAVDTAGGRVIVDRRVQYPAGSTAELVEALKPLVREAVRGLVPATGR